MNRLLVWLTSLILAIVIAGCGPLDLLNPRKFQDGVSQTTPFHDGVTQTTPLVTGEVLLASGEPAANVSVTAYVSDYQVAAVGNGVKQVETRTDAAGRFKLVDPPLGMNTIEAQATEDSKAIRMNVPVSVGARLNLDPLTLQPTGAITGRVKAEGVSNLLGTMVFIPGTHYLAISDPQGAYTLKHVPVGSYDVAAMRQTFATTLVSGVTVAPQQTVQAPDLVLSLDAPVLESLSQSNGGAGAEIVLRGKNFGATKNTVLSVHFGSTQATRFERLSDTEIRVWVPAGALSGPVVVRSNGVASNAVDFQVIALLSVTPLYAGVLQGDRRKFEVEARDPLGAPVLEPNVRWELGNSIAGKLVGAGNFEGDGEGWSEVWVKSGSITGLAAVAVSRYEISRVASPLAQSNLIPNKLWESPEGSYYFSDLSAQRLYRQDPDGTLAILAGFANSGFSPDGTPAAEASLDSPSGVVADDAGNVFFSESGAHRIRVIPRRDGTLFGRPVMAGRLQTLAGTGAKGFDGDGPNAHQLALQSPRDLDWEKDGSLIFVDSGNRRIRRLSHDGILTTLVGGGARAFTEPEMEPLNYGGTIAPSFALDAHGNVIFSSFAERENARIFFFCRAAGTYYGQSRRAGFLYALTAPPAPTFYRDGPASGALVSYFPREIDVTPAGEILISDFAGKVLRRIDAQGRLTTLAGAMMPLMGLTAPAVSPPSSATAYPLELRYMHARPDGSILLWEDAATWRLTRVRP
jgi:sugar lactone lactonase YvrE